MSCCAYFNDCQKPGFRTILIPQPPKMCVDKEIKFDKTIITEPMMTTRTRRIMIPKPYIINKILHIPKITWDKKVFKQREYTYVPCDYNEPLIVPRKREIIVPKIIARRKVYLDKPMQLCVPSEIGDTIEPPPCATSSTSNNRQMFNYYYTIYNPYNYQNSYSNSGYCSSSSLGFNNRYMYPNNMPYVSTGWMRYPISDYGGYGNYNVPYFGANDMSYMSQYPRMMPPYSPYSNENFSFYGRGGGGGWPTWNDSFMF